jgi:LacI family transcriptional regulator
MLTHPANESSSVTARIHGYQRALRTARIDPLPEWLVEIDLATHLAGYRDGVKWRGGCVAIKPVLPKLELPCAVLAIDAYVGWGVYEACQELGLRIPEDVSVVAFDDSEIAHAIRPPMTIISQRTDEIGRTAVELLMRRLNTGHGEDGARRTFTQAIIDVDLIERQSVAVVRNK